MKPLPNVNDTITRGFERRCDSRLTAPAVESAMSGGATSHRPAAPAPPRSLTELAATAALSTCRRASSLPRVLTALLCPSPTYSGAGRPISLAGARSRLATPPLCGDDGPLQHPGARDQTRMPSNRQRTGELIAGCELRGTGTRQTQTAVEQQYRRLSAVGVSSSMLQQGRATPWPYENASSAVGGSALSNDRGTTLNVQRSPRLQSESLTSAGDLVPPAPTTATGRT